MSPQYAILAIGLHGAFVDGAKDDREREHLRRMAESLGQQGDELPRLYQDVLLGRVSVADAVGALSELGERQLAYEMAVCVCDADGRQCEAERRFLAELKDLLGLAGDAHSLDVERHADELAALPVTATAQAPATESPDARSTAAQVAGAHARAPGAAGDRATAAAGRSTVTRPELDRTVLNASILNGALELLPQSWASVAIIPLQLRMVYRIGQAHGYELDQGHVKEFLATAGVGLTSQYLEQFGRKLVGGLLGRMAGRGIGKLGRAATGIAFSFATTYALGQLAIRYYSGGRQMDGQTLRETFQQLLGPAKAMQSRYLPQIEQRASGLDASQVMALVRGA